MANEELRFDIIGNDRATGAFSRVGGSVKDMGDRMNIATKQALVLDEAMNRQRTAARSSVDATLALAKADDILAEAEHTLRDGALEAEFALKKETEAKKKSGDAALAAAAKNKAFQDSLNKVASKAQEKGGPSWLGPALLAAPAATSIAGVGAGAAIGLGGAFVTAGIALAGYGTVAKSVLSQASKATQAVSKAQDAYNLAIASGTNKAKAYKAEQLAIEKAYAGMSPAQIQLSKQLGGISSQWDKFKQSVTPLIASSLQPWLKGVSTGLQSLKSLITPVGPVVHDLGVQFGTLVNSSTFRTFMAWTGATGGKVIGSAGNAVLDLITAMTFLLPQFTPLIKGAADGISKWGDAFVKWSASQKAADEIHSFLGWFHDNGPLVTGLLKNVGGALKALAPGIGPAAAGELKVISGFFGFIAKLPPGLAKPLTEVAASLLILNKLGVVKAGVQLASAGKGAWAKALPGVSLVGGALVATVVVNALLSAADPHKKGENGFNNPFGADPTSKDPAKQGLSTWAGLGHDIEHIFDNTRQGIAHIWDLMWNNTVARLNRGSADTLKVLGGWQHNVSHWFDTARHEVASIWDSAWNNTVGRLNRGSADTIKLLSGWQHNVSHWFDVARNDTAHIWDVTWNNTIGRLNRGSADTIRVLSGWEHNVAHWFDTARHDIASAWDTAWNNTVGRAQRGVNDVVRWVSTVPGRVTGVFRGARSWLYNQGRDILYGLWDGLEFVWHKVTGWISSLAGWIKAHKGPVSFDRSLLEPAGRALMTGLRVGLEGGWVGIKDIVSGMAGNIGNQFSGLMSLGGKVGSFFSSLFGGGSGALGGDAAANKALARKMFPWPTSMFPAYDYLEMREAGYNRFARNPSSGAYGIPQALPPTKMPFAAQAAGGSHAGPQLSWQFGYIGSVYGNPVNAANHERAFNWYADGTLSAAPGWAVVGERGPELMHFRGGEQVIPHHAASAGSTYVINVHPTPLARPADIGREVVGAIRAHEQRSGKGWRS